MSLPSYRSVHLRVFTVRRFPDAPASESAEVATALRGALGRYGAVAVREHGPYWKIPERLEFTIHLAPSGRVGPVLDALRALAPGGWDDTPERWDSVWTRGAGNPGEVFLHPDVEWAGLTGVEADPVGTPRYRDGDQVRIADTPRNREWEVAGLRGVVYGDADPYGRNRSWRYGVFPVGQDTLVLVDETELEPVTDTARRNRAIASLRGLAVGDALGSQFFVPENRGAFERRETPPGPWEWTDDTEMACSVFAVLDRYGRIEQDPLAALFAEHHDFDRGYGPSTNRMLRLPWSDRLAREGGGLSGQAMMAAA
ncbi:ADP-ribosylglycohydrolase family protein, partial [Actinomadura kijaniata]|uniref:ADP-ribosylglycohydrolase family protein n=1 Tax=Actinomadura kijaniata TaxID=46161 RepID=UPI003F1A7959